MLAFWLSLILLLAAVVAGVAFAVVRGLRLWRLARATGARFSADIERISGGAARIEEHLSVAGAAGTRLQESNARLAEARAQLDVQRAALREARADVRRVLWFVPGL